MSLPRFPESYWLSSADIPAFEPLKASIDVEVAVIGGGITGITTAYLLAKEGKRTALLTSGSLIGGTTGYTTAKITVQHNLIYDEHIRHFGLEKAGLFYQANNEALAFIRKKVEEYGIDCDFTEEDAFVYATTDVGEELLRKEVAAYRELNIPGYLTDDLPLPFPVRSALGLRGQARFHPVPYLVRLVTEFVRMGGQVYEDTMVEAVEEGSPNRLKIGGGIEAVCDDVVSCSHFPVLESGLYFARLHAESSYVLAARLPHGQELPAGMYISADNPTRSIRTVTYKGEKLLLLGGESHKTGQGVCTIKHYEALEGWANSVFGVTDFPYRWSTNDFVTLDKLPYIGQATGRHPHSFVATGYRKWGMTSGTAAALLLTDLIVGRDNRYRELFDPVRFQADPDLKELIVQNADVAKQMIAGKLEWLTRKPDELGRDEGALVRIGGRKAGAYRDAEGELFLVDSTCTHLGCEVEWNNGDRTWDCPCHGSRFHYDGGVLEGPATEPLKRIE
ncbi:FAD-dependent oxidoreductase [Gorillibacterium massiliense]|uniref:FAD-dependent oxidoreductase n=1 Tax=Gorillibacterium massiliense TaxID=1280390 RepID=UPI0004B7E043|nr:FAD-dependent oxidoreductase [Gorillibacterium massiliense]